MVCLDAPVPLRRFLVLAVALLALVAGCASDQQVIDQANEFHSQLKPAVITDPKLAGYLQSIGNRVVTSARSYARETGLQEPDRDWMFSRDMQFHFVNSNTLNAFTTGGEHMYIYTQLFEEVKSEDELAAVISHEYAHVFCRHVQSGINRQYAILGTAAAAGAGGYAVGGKEKGAEYGALAAGAATAAAGLIGMHYTRGDEAQADQMGFEFYTRAGWDPNHFGDFFQHMIDKGLDKGPEFLSDHPSLASRVEASKQWAAALPGDAKKYRKAPTAEAVAIANYQKSAVTVGKSMPTDQALTLSQKLLDSVSRSCISPTISPDQKKAEEEMLTAVEEKKAEKGKKK